MGGTNQPTRIIVADRIFVRTRKDAVLLHSELTTGFEHSNPQRFMKEKLGIWCGDEPRTITTWEASDDPEDPEYEFLTFPRGGMARVRGAFERLGFAYDIEDGRCYGEPAPKYTHAMNLYEHQELALAAILERENCILRSPTGSGKTTTILAAIARMQVPALIVVPNRKLFDQWVERVVFELGIARKDIGEIRGGKFTIKPVTIGIQKSVALKSAHPKMVDYFGMIIADEVDLFAAKTFFAAIDPYPARFRFGVSADHRRKDRKQFLIHDLFGDVVMHIKHEELVKSGHVLDVEIRVVPTDFRADWYGSERSDDDDGTWSPTKGDKEPDYNRTRLLTEMQNDGDRNRIAIRAARELLARGDQVFVLVEYREHCSIIDQAISGMGTRTGLLIGGDDYAAEFSRTVHGLRDGSLQAGIGTYKALARGIDIPRVGTAVCVTPVAGNEQLLKQVRGRICRTSTGKTGACMVYLWDRFVYPDHLANLARWNASTVIQDDQGKWVPAKTWIKQRRAA
jgi:superfamily II DNA or RNA helicase